MAYSGGILSLEQLTDCLVGHVLPKRPSKSTRFELALPVIASPLLAHLDFITELDAALDPVDELLVRGVPVA